jgi:hypothetical protein
MDVTARALKEVQAAALCLDHDALMCDSWLESKSSGDGPVPDVERAAAIAPRALAHPNRPKQVFFSDHATAFPAYRVSFIQETIWATSVDLILVLLFSSPVFWLQQVDRLVWVTSYTTRHFSAAIFTHTKSLRHEPLFVASRRITAAQRTKKQNHSSSRAS